jgi:hypothetical protein
MYVYTSKGYKFVEYDEGPEQWEGTCDDCGKAATVFEWDHDVVCNDCARERDAIENQGYEREREWLAAREQHLNTQTPEDLDIPF